MNRWHGMMTWLEALDLGMCHGLNRTAAWRPVRWGFQWISRIGDGLIWYALMLVLALWGGALGLATAALMAVTGLLGLLIYRALKQGVVRPRPFHRHHQISCHIPPMDQYSFPSGHTLHAVSFTLIACSSFPALASVLLPLTLLIALSRMVLGVHYPSDVLVGAGLGWALAKLMLWLTALTPSVA